MAKKKVKVKSGQFIDLFAVLLGIAAVCMMFLTCVKTTGKLSGIITEYKGTDVVFGNDSGIITTTFSFMAMLPYLLAAIGVVLVALNLFGVCDLELVAFAAFVVAAVFFFLAPNFILFTNSDTKSLYNFSLGVGSILAGVFAALAGLSLVAKKFVK